MEPSTIDGNESLIQQQNTLNFTENTASVKTVSYVIADPASDHLNEATFEDVPQTQIVPPLRLVPAGDVPAGQQPIFVSDIWVSGVIRKIAALR